MKKKTTAFPLDLSALTDAEIQQFVADPYTLYNGHTNVALYLRFSSERQTEQSIEGQLRDCVDYCKREGLRIVAIYVDRATSAHKNIEKRVNFQRMITDSATRFFSAVVVWKLDRFARNRKDSALSKLALQKNGVRVLSAKENVNSDAPENIILEAVLEGMAEFYSADLSQKITRGMRESALKGKHIAGSVPLGYKKDREGRLEIDPVTAPIVQDAFNKYAAGWTTADICRDFNAKGYRTRTGGEFNRSSFKNIFRNEKYIGIYQYKDIVMDDVIPPLVSRELFDEVQKRLEKNGESPARGKAKVDYLLAGKVFCGHCGSPMNGESGTSKSGNVYHYYKCYNKKRGGTCDKKPVQKDWLENVVAQDALELLTDELIEEIATVAVNQSEQEIKSHTRIPELESKIKELDDNIANIAKAIEKGVISDTLVARMNDLESQKSAYMLQLDSERKLTVKLDKWQVTYWLTRFRDGDINDPKWRKTLFNLLINSVTVWDTPDGFKITIVCNLTSTPIQTVTVSNDGTVFGFEDVNSTRPLISEHPDVQVLGQICAITKEHPAP